MDLTPHDLRNAELREAFRGYRPDEVEELLERAAVTLERVHERNRMLQERLNSVETETSEGKEIESVLRQTLLLAQRTADETLTTAHERARLLVEEAEDRALSLVSEAEDQARRIGETNRAKYEAIVSELSARRDLLVSDIEILERVQTDYRARLRATLERELEELKARPVLPPINRPDLREIDLSAAEDEEEADAGPPTVPLTTGGATNPESGETETLTEALVVLDDEPSDNGRSGTNRRLG
jgi:cell division initiation protein